MLSQISASYQPSFGITNRVIPSKYRKTKATPQEMLNLCNEYGVYGASLILDVSEGAIRYNLKKNNLFFKRSKKEHFNLEEVKNLYIKKGVCAAAKELGVNVHTLRTYLKENKVWIENPRPNSKILLTADRIGIKSEDVREMRNKGFLIKEIANFYGVSKLIIRRFIKDHIEDFPDYNMLKKTRTDVIKNSKSAADLSKKLNISKGYASNLRKKYVKNAEEISFGSAQKLNNSFAAFNKELVSYVRNNKNIEFKQLEELIQKFSPETRVVSMSELPSNSNATSRTSAYYANRMLFDNKGKSYLTNKVIYLDLPKSDTNTAKMTFWGSVLHEMTHIFQQESPDRVSTKAFIDEFLKDKKLDLSTLATIKIMPQAFRDIEHHVVTPLLETLRKTSNLPVKIPSASQSQLDDIYCSLIPVPSTKDYIKLVVKAIIRNYKKVTPFPFDEEAVKKYVKFVAGNEKEAYQKSLQVVKSQMGITGATDLDLRVLLYENFEKAL